MGYARARAAPIETPMLTVTVRLADPRLLTPTTENEDDPRPRVGCRPLLEKKTGRRPGLLAS